MEDRRLVKILLIMGKFPKNFPDQFYKLKILRIFQWTQIRLSCIFEVEKWNENF